MAGKTSEISLLRAIFELFGIVLTRFRPVARIWGAWLIAVNSASVFFLAHVEAQVALGAVSAAALAQALIYQRSRFIRMLGSTHILWVPMLAWMAMRLDTAGLSDTPFHYWLILLIATNAISLAIDACDATRFALGERRPYYVW